MFNRKARRIKLLELNVAHRDMLINQAVKVMDRAGEKLTLEPPENKEPVVVGNHLHQAAAKLTEAAEKGVEYV